MPGSHPTPSHPPDDPALSVGGPDPALPITAALPTPPTPPGLQSGPDDPLLLPQALHRELRQALRSIHYGAIELVIHDGRVVQLERHETVRVDVESGEHKRQ